MTFSFPTPVSMRRTLASGKEMKSSRLMVLMSTRMTSGMNPSGSGWFCIAATPWQPALDKRLLIPSETRQLDKFTSTFITSP